MDHNRNRQNTTKSENTLDILLILIINYVEVCYEQCLEEQMVSGGSHREHRRVFSPPRRMDEGRNVVIFAPNCAAMERSNND